MNFIFKIRNILNSYTIFFNEPLNGIFGLKLGNVVNESDFKKVDEESLTGYYSSVYIIIVFKSMKISKPPPVAPKISKFLLLCNLFLLIISSEL